MSSLLIIVPVEKLQKKIDETVKSFTGMPGIYVSLNKTAKSMEGILSKSGISTRKLFFIDCVTARKTMEDVVHVAPDRLKKLNAAISEFILDIKGKKFLIIDALSTLLIYNRANDVAKFIEKLIGYASENDVDTVALSPETRGEELLNKIFNFFDEVKKE